MTTHAPVVLPKKNCGGPGRIHRRLLNEAGEVSEEMEMGCHFHIPAETVGFFLRCGLFPWRLRDSPL